MNQFVLIVNGPIGGGKTAVINSLISQRKKVFIVSPNKIKFLISDYTPDRDRTLVHEATFLVAQKMFEGGMSLIIEGGSIMQGSLNDRLKELAQQHDSKVVTVNIEAPLSVLKDRFTERLETARARGSKLSVTTDEEFMKRYEAFNERKAEAQETFDSSLSTPDEIAQRINALI